MNASSHAPRARRRLHARLHGRDARPSLLLFTGLAVDGGRAYVVKAQLTKAVDGAALGAARKPEQRAIRSAEAIADLQGELSARLVSARLGGDRSDGAGLLQFNGGRTATGVNIVTVTATADAADDVHEARELRPGHRLEHRSRRPGAWSTCRWSSTCRARSGRQWTAVRDAARTFINSFDANGDRVALLTFGNGARCSTQMPSTRGFNKAKVVRRRAEHAARRQHDDGRRAVSRVGRAARRCRPGSSPACASSCCSPTARRTACRASRTRRGAAKGLRTYDFPKNAGDPDGQTWDSPHIDRPLRHADAARSPARSTCQVRVELVDDGADRPTRCCRSRSCHAHGRAGIPTSFPLQSTTLTVNGRRQDVDRARLRDQNAATGRYPAEVCNINNAARNLRRDHRQRGAQRRRRLQDPHLHDRHGRAGALHARHHAGDVGRHPEAHRQRQRPRRTSTRRSSKGKYYYAKTAADVGPAFQGIQNQIIRLSK